MQLLNFISFVFYRFAHIWFSVNYRRYNSLITLKSGSADCNSLWFWYKNVLFHIVNCKSIDWHSFKVTSTVHLNVIST